jgi:hypothetical protein
MNQVGLEDALNALIQPIAFMPFLFDENYKTPEVVVDILADKFSDMLDAEINEFNQRYPDARWGAAHLVLEDKNTDKGYIVGAIDTIDSLIVHFLGGTRTAKNERHFDSMVEIYTEKVNDDGWLVQPEQRVIEVLDELMATRNFLANVLWRYEVLWRNK